MCGWRFLMTAAATLAGSVFMFWNIENAFDPYDDPLTRDDDFTAAGVKHWSWSRMQRKLNGIAKTVLAVADSCGELPSLVGLCEVENAMVLRRLVSETPLEKTDYDWIHRDSPDPRGIDVALLYRRSAFRPLPVCPIPVGCDPPTRDILYVKGILDRDTVHLFVNHWPSKLGGAAGRARRRAAAAALCACVDSIDAAAPHQAVILCGDFNATPDEMDLPVPALENLAAPLAAAGEGSLKYRGTWELIDQFWLRQPSGGASRRPEPRMKVFRPPFLLEEDTGYTGMRPRRTYSGPRYTGGLSDHLPVLLIF